MTSAEAMERLEAVGNEKLRASNGAGDNQFGVKMGDIRALAKEIKIDHVLGLELWKTGNIDARFLASLILKPKLLDASELESMLSYVSYVNLADWFCTNVVKQHPDKESLREVWMASSNEIIARLGWSLTTERVTKSPGGLDFDAILDRLDREMAEAPKVVQWTMNFCLGEIGITLAAHRERVLAMAERIGAFRDYPTSKGCTSPFVPLWVAEMVRRGVAQ